MHNLFLIAEGTGLEQVSPYAAIIPVVITTAVVAILTLILVQFVNRLRGKDAAAEAAAVVQKAKTEAENMRKECELELKELKLENQAENEKRFRETQTELHERERNLDKRQDAIDEQNKKLAKQERVVETTQSKLTEHIDECDRRKADLDKLLDMEQKTLHEISGLTKEEATERFMAQLESQMTQRCGSVILKHEAKLKEEVEEKSRELLLSALQRFAAAHTAETTTSSVDIPSDEMKGRIIGREGRNIRSFEKATGVDVIIDDTPGVVIVSAFDPIRREVARRSLEKLITDGRIHPSRIEELVASTTSEIEKLVQKTGKEATQEVGIFSLHERVVNLLGRLHFRTSYGQNVLRHSIEVAFIAGIIAEELGLDGELARRCGLLHDIGKAIDHELEGGHPKIGADLLKRYGECKEVIDAAAGHHDERRIEFPYTILIAAADAASASRPGARRETLERYVKRMEELETIACEFQGVEQAFAIQAGRELRVLVDSKKTTDETAAKVCNDIARAYEERLTYPGEIKITVIRESRHIETAK